MVMIGILTFAGMGLFIWGMSYFEIWHMGGYGGGQHFGPKASCEEPYCVSYRK